MMTSRLTSEMSGSKHSQAGQAMVEFALVIFFVFIVFVSAVQMILLMHAYNTLADAAKDRLGGPCLLRDVGHRLQRKGLNPRGSTLLLFRPKCKCTASTRFVGKTSMAFPDEILEQGFADRIQGHHGIAVAAG